MIQPDPMPNERIDVFTRVIDDLETRREHGIETYGVALQAFNERDQGRDAYEEVLDLVVYLRALREEYDEICGAARAVVDSAEGRYTGDLDLEAVSRLHELLKAAGR